MHSNTNWNTDPNIRKFSAGDNKAVHCSYLQLSLHAILIMAFKFILLLLVLSYASKAYSQSEQATVLVDPTGLYKLVAKTKIKNGDTYGYFGDIKVKLLSASSIVINFYVCKGAPSYNSGSFSDTLDFANNEAIFRTSNDISCSVTFHFTETGVDVLEKTADYNSGCGFGNAVIADGFYKKISAKILELRSTSAE